MTRRAQGPAHHFLGSQNCLAQPAGGHNRGIEALKTRRLQEAAMSGRGKRQVDAAVAPGVSAQTGSRWCRVQHGREGWLGRAERRRKLSDDQLAEAEAVPQNGPRANEFPTGMWTLAPAEVIERVFRGLRSRPALAWNRGLLAGTQ